MWLGMGATTHSYGYKGTFAIGCVSYRGGGGGLPRGYNYPSTLTSTGSLSALQAQHEGFHQRRGKDFHLKVYPSLPDHSGLSEVAETRCLAGAAGADAGLTGLRRVW